VCETELEDALHLGGGECYEYIYKVYGGDNITGSPITTHWPCKGEKVRRSHLQ
jgi:hypothetical protein